MTRINNLWIQQLCVNHPDNTERIESPISPNQCITLQWHDNEVLANKGKGTKNKNSSATVAVNPVEHWP